MRIVSVLLALAMSTAGCAAFNDDDASGVQVAAAFYPLAYVAERVAGEHATVANLTTPGQEPHDLEPTITETALIAGADLVLHERGLQTSIDVAVEQNAGGVVLDAAAVVGLQPFADGNGLDPHFWLDPLRMAVLGAAVADSLAEIDPDHADAYASNAADLRADLEALDRRFEEGLADCERSTIVVSHDAFGYLTRYGLDVAPIAGLSPDAEPTPADLAALQRLIAADGITTVFSERLAPKSLTSTLASDMGIRTAVLDPLEGLSEETAGETYLTLMEQNLTALEEANACR